MSTIAFNDKIFLEQGLEAFVANLAPLRAFANDFSGATSRKGDAVIVPRVDAVTATTFDQSYETAGGEINAITVNLNQHKISTVDLTDTQAANHSPAQIGNFARQQGKALAKMVLQTMWSIITPGTFGAAIVTTAAANWTRTQVRAIRKALIEGNADSDMLSLIVNSDIYDALLGDTNITQAFQYGGTEAIRDGRIPRVLGFDLYESNVIPTNGVTLFGFGVHPDSMAVAMRYLEPQAPGEYLQVASATDDQSGITLGYRRHFNPGTGKHYASFECVFGFAAGITPGLKIITGKDS